MRVMSIHLADAGGGSDRGALSALVLGAACIAWAPILFRMTEVEPVATAFWRLALAWPVLAIWAAWQGRHAGAKRVPVMGDRALLLLAGVFFAGDLAFWHWALTRTSVAHATLFANAAPLFVSLAAWLVFGRHFRPLFWTGLLAAIIGSGMLLGASLQLGANNLLGDVLGIVTALFLAGYLLTVEKLRTCFSTAAIMSWSAGAGVAVLLPLMALTEVRIVPSTLQGWTVLLGLALISHAAGQSLIAFSMSRLPAAFTAVSLLLQPLLAALFAWMLLGENLGPLQVTGGAVILGGILLARMGSR